MAAFFRIKFGVLSGPNAFPPIEPSSMTALHITHFYFSEIPPRGLNKYNTLIHRVNSHIRDICSKLKNIDYMPTPVTKQHLSLGGIHLNDKGQQKLTAAMAEVFNNHAITGQSFHIPTIITMT